MALVNDFFVDHYDCFFNQVSCLITNMLGFLLDRTPIQNNTQNAV